MPVCLGASLASALLQAAAASALLHEAAHVAGRGGGTRAALDAAPTVAAALLLTSSVCGGSLDGALWQARPLPLILMESFERALGSVLIVGVLAYLTDSF